jgi:hypothetical protein
MSSASVSVKLTVSAVNEANQEQYREHNRVYYNERHPDLKAASAVKISSVKRTQIVRGSITIAIK